MRYLARWNNYINLLNSVVKLNKFISYGAECSHPIRCSIKSIGGSPIISGLQDDLFCDQFVGRCELLSTQKQLSRSCSCRFCSQQPGDI